MKANHNHSILVPVTVNGFGGQIESAIALSGRKISGCRPRLFSYRPGLAAAVVLLAGIPLVSCKSGSSGDVAARVGSREIKMDQINTTIKQQLDANGGTNAPSTGAELAAAQLSVLDNLIQAEVLVQKAQREKLDPDDAKVSQEIERQKQEARLTEDEYQKRLKQKGMTEASLRDQVKTQLAINALHEKENARVKAPTDQDIRKYYDEHRSQFIAERGAEISVIVTDPANNGVPDDAIGDAAAEQKIRTIYDQLKSGLDFATLASQQSEDQSSRAADGKLGFASEAQLNQTFGTQMVARLMSMSPGQYTEPIKDSGSGRWYILKVNSKREQPQNRTFDEARQEIINNIIQQRQEVLWTALLRSATAEASIKNFLADRIVDNPETVVMMKPSELAAPTLAPEQQPQPRFENQNRAPASGAPLGSKSPARNANQ